MTRTLAALLCAAALLSACGGNPPTASPSDPPPADPTTSVTEATTATATEVTKPLRIVSLSATATEMLFAIGAGDQVVAVDDQSDYPPEAPRTNLSGLEPNLEAIASYEPDVVIASFAPESLVPGLERLGIEVIQHNPAVTLDDSYEQVRELGEVTGHSDEAEALVEGMQSEITEILASVPDRQTQPTYYHELDNTLYTVTSETFIGSLYTMAGLRNVADPADAKGQSGGYPQLSREFLVEADPDFVFLADTVCCQQNAETFAKRPGFAKLTAVRQDRVVELNDDVASRWGPRIVELLQDIVAATSSVQASARAAVPVS
jgi:iron complex transport system substrate-binding protein